MNGLLTMLPALRRSGSRLDGQADGDGAAAPLGVADVQHALVAGDDLLAHRQADAGASGLGRTLIELVLDVGQLLLGDTRGHSPGCGSPPRPLPGPPTRRSACRSRRAWRRCPADCRTPGAAAPGRREMGSTSSGQSVIVSARCPPGGRTPGRYTPHPPARPSMSRGSTDRVKRPSSMRENSSSSSTMLVRRRASETMMPMPFCTSWASPHLAVHAVVSAQPLMAVRGVRSSWETEEINSDWVFSDCLIFMDMSLMVSVSSPISSSYFFSICIP